MRDREDRHFSKTVRAIGEGYSIPNDTTAHLQASSRPQTCTVQGVTDFQHLIDLVYPDLFTADSSSFADRGILAPTNTSTDEINAHILNLLQNTSYSLKSADKLSRVLEHCQRSWCPPSYLRPQRCVVMFIRNINFDCGIVNGRKGIVRSISSRIVDVHIIADGSPLVKIPRITFEVQVGRNGLSFHRQQFPLRVCHAITINKSQADFIQGSVGLDLPDDVFCHGQLYVALSRTTSSRNVMTLVM
ncbi:unnamed protein product, partial [Scytosiphon promiscuus]